MNRRKAKPKKRTGRRPAVLAAASDHPLTYEEMERKSNREFIRKLAYYLRIQVQLERRQRLLRKKGVLI